MDKRRIGKFQVLRTLGSGAHSTILHVRCSSDSRQYALKVAPINSKEDHKFLIQAQHEFTVAQMLNHPNLIKVYALETQRDWLFRIRKVHMLIEYVNGQTLDVVPPLSLARQIQVFAKIAAGMVHMHRRQVCHADLKPNNILLSKTGEVKIIDYGLAWIKGEDKGRVQGTPEYMAPEQVRKGTVNECTDIYNFGATMYRLAAFRLPPSPLAATNGVPVDAGIFQKMLKPVQECNAQAPPALCQLIHHCLAFQPQKRPERMSNVQEVLERLVKDVVTSPEDRLEALEW